MNELIQALGNYTEALEQKITVLEERISGYEEKVAALEERIEELAKDSRFYVRPNSSPSEPEEPETPEEQEIPELVAEQEPEPVVEPEPEPEPVVEPEPEPEPEPEQPKKEPELALDIEPQPAKTAVKDIRQMISLGDRFLFQRELFGQNGEKMQRALDDINRCATEQEALDFVEKHFDWDKKSPTYELFINAIHRSHSGR